MLAVPRVTFLTNVGVHFFGGLEKTMPWQARDDVDDMLPFSWRHTSLCCLGRFAWRLNCHSHTLAGGEIWRAHPRVRRALGDVVCPASRRTIPLRSLPARRPTRVVSLDIATAHRKLTRPSREHPPHRQNLRALQPPNDRIGERRLRRITRRH